MPMASRSLSWRGSWQVRNNTVDSVTEPGGRYGKRVEVRAEGRAIE
jgi:hypothetical protein